jgi:ParB family chromosome partitioning protein
MAKRRKLVAPSAEHLNAIDAEFRSETPARPNPATAPIAQIASDSAQASRLDDAQTRLDRLDAEQLRDAQEKGLIVNEIPTNQIRVDAMIRDRTVLDADEMTELQVSIAANGLRLPIEVFQDNDGYALLSGYRRLIALRALAAQNNDGQYSTIKAFVRPATDTASAFVAMVEENEVRANLSHFERGRIAVIAAQQGAFGSTEEAVNALFASASKSKRSKVRSFAEVFEMLGDMLSHAEGLTERRGLRLAGALRQGGEDRLRAALEAGQGGSADHEWAAIERLIEEIEDGPQLIAKRGRPRTTQPLGWTGNDTLRLSSGVVLRKEHDGKDYVIRLSGAAVTKDFVDVAMEELRMLFEKP